MNGLKARAENTDSFYKWNEQPLSVTAIFETYNKNVFLRICMKGSEQERFN